MARLYTIGCDWRHLYAEQGIGTGNEQTVVHSPGGSSVRVPLNPNPGNGLQVGTPISFNVFVPVVGRRYFARAYFRMNRTTPDGAATPRPKIGIAGTNSITPTVGIYIALTTENGGATPAGRLGMFVGGVQIGAYTSALAVDTWHCIEFSWVEATSATVEVRLNGVTVGTTTATVTNSNQLVGFGYNNEQSAGSGATSPTPTFYYDDFGLNDDQGADQNTWCGEGFVYLLRPSSDSARSGWLNGAGGTTNLWDAVDNQPPNGQVAGLTATTQITNAVKATTENYDGLCPSYDSVQGSPGETVKLAFAICNDAETGAGTKTGVVHILSNPAQTEPTTGQQGFFNYGNDAGAPSAAFTSGLVPGWYTHWGPTAYSGFTEGVAPVVRVGKRTSSSNTVYVDELGIIVETAPAAAPAVLPPHRARSVPPRSPAPCGASFSR